MKKPTKASATLIGAFAVGGLVLLVAAVIAAGGGQLFARKERVQMVFSGSIYGLSVGAPVSFRGVRLGNVSAIGLVYDKARDEFIIPVTAELEPASLRGLSAEGSSHRSVLAQMVARGLRAQLSMQSLLTGQLYVDLDLRPDKPAVLRGRDTDELLEIPTTATAIQQLKNQLDGLDFRRLLDDVSAIAESARTILAGPQLKQAMADLVTITGNVSRMTAKLDARIDPLAQTAQKTFADASDAAKRLGQAAERVGGASDKLGSAAVRYRELVAPDSPLILSLQNAVNELALTTGSLRQEFGSDSELLHNADRALVDLSRAARAVRELAELLDRHPDALLRGKPPEAIKPAKPEATR